MSAKSLVAAGLLAAFSASTARADVVSDRAAAILIVPYVASVEVAPVSFDAGTVGATVDTVIQISNTSTDPVILQCFYVNANGHCAITNDACYPDGGSIFGPCVVPGDLCLPGWTETDFRVILTPRQPIAWRASTGLGREEFPLDGVAFRGPRGDSNAGSAVPPVVRETLDISKVPGAPEIQAFAGELKCVVVDAEGHGTDRNVIKGEATVVSEVRTDAVGDPISRFPRVAKYNAYGVQAIGGDVNGDGDLALGGNEEYNNCPNFLIIDHFFDFAIPELNNVGGAEEQRSALTLVPCSQNIRRQIPGATTAQFLVFNEFEQRFSTSRKVDCWFNRQLSLIDTTDPTRSIFSAGVAGTVAGQTRVRGVTGGLLGVLHENIARERIGLVGIDDVLTNVHLQGDRDDIDHIVLP